MIKLGPDDLQLLRQFYPDAHARSSQPTWELAGSLGLERAAVDRSCAKLAGRGLVHGPAWRSGVKWWTVTERGREAVEIALAQERQARANSGVSAARGHVAANG